LRTLQQAGGAYCLVTTHEDNEVRASLRNFQEGDGLCVLRSKEDDGCPRTDQLSARYPGYALKLTFDVPEGKAMGILNVKACWHEVVFKSEFGFTESNFLY
jgi:hypothetical protein